MSQEKKKMTIDEYEKKYTRRENKKVIKPLLFALEATLGIGIAALLFFVVLKLFELHEIAGYVGIGVSVLVFIFCYIVPMAKTKKLKAFDTNVNRKTAKAAQKHNKELRREIADKIIDFNESVDGIGWYNSTLVGEMAVALHVHDDAKLKETLTKIYDQDIKNTAKTIIREHAVKVGLVTAISQSEKVDALFMAMYELNLIRQLTFLYGFRPSDAKLMRIYIAVLKNALISYGLDSIANNLGNAIVHKIGGVLSSMPALGNIVSNVIGSVSEGVINGGLTVIIGHQTMRYLAEEYKLQDALDDIELDNIDEKEMMAEIKNDIISESKNLKKQAKE